MYDVLHIGREDVVKMMLAFKNEQNSSWYSQELDVRSEAILEPLEALITRDVLINTSDQICALMQDISEDSFFNGFSAALQLQRALDGMRRDYIEGLNRRMSKQATESPTSVSSANTSSNT